MSRPPDDLLIRLGASMREINPSTLQQDPEDGDIRWFLGDNGTELFVWSHTGEAPHHIQLVFARVSVEWSDKRGLVTGTFAAGSSTSGGRYDQYLMHVGNVADPEVCVAALTLLQATLIDARIKASLEGPLQAVIAGRRQSATVLEMPAAAPGPLTQALENAAQKQEPVTDKTQITPPPSDPEKKD